jgi:hypothetical protein
MTEETKEVTSAEATQPKSGEQTAPELNISDLIAVKNIIEVASQRGAFKAAEMEAVGKIFNKLNAFLEAVSKKEE